jgi:hypothetical protein
MSYPAIRNPSDAYERMSFIEFADSLPWHEWILFMLEFEEFIDAVE